MHIDSEKYAINEKNYIPDNYSKNKIIIGISGRKDNFHIIRLKNSEYGNSKKWPTYSINREGLIFQHFNPEYYSNFTEIEEIDKNSISIVLENMGSLLMNENNQYVNWLNETCNPNMVVNKKMLGYSYWEKLSTKQLYTCSNLCKMLCEKFNIEKNVITFHYYNENMISFNGIATFSNFINETNNINPLLNLNKLQEMVNIV